MNKSENKLYRIHHKRLCLKILPDDIAIHQFIKNKKYTDEIPQI